MPEPRHDKWPDVPSIDSLARQLAAKVPLPHPVLVDCARRAVSERPDDVAAVALGLARDVERALLTNVINATGVLLHTNLGRAPVAPTGTGRASNLELDLASGERGSRQTAPSALLGTLIGSEAAFVVNNNAAAVLLALAATAAGRDVAVSRGECVEIGGGFRIPDVLAQSGARLVDVGTTNRTRADDYRRAIRSDGHDVAAMLKVHPANFTIEGFIETTTIAELAALDVPVIADLGSGLLDARVPWVAGAASRPLPWLRDEPGARQALDDGAALVTFSGDKLLGGPQCGIIAGRADLVARCARHPLARALRPGSHVLATLQAVLLHHLDRTVCDAVPFWRMATTPVDVLRERAQHIAAGAEGLSIVELDSVVGAGAAPRATIPSIGLSSRGDRRAELREHTTPIIARAADGRTVLDLRTIEPSDDALVLDALRRH